MTALHVVLLIGKKTAEDTLQTAKLLMEHGLRDLINEADSLGATWNSIGKLTRRQHKDVFLLSGNTPLHVLIARYALEERRYGFQDSHQPWNRWDMLHIVRYLLQVWCYISSINICFTKLSHMKNVVCRMVRGRLSTTTGTQHWPPFLDTWQTGNFVMTFSRCC